MVSIWELDEEYSLQKLPEHLAKTPEKIPELTKKFSLKSIQEMPKLECILSSDNSKCKYDIPQVFEKYQKEAVLLYKR